MYLMYKLPFVECLMFGALISATDPVTVLSIFQVMFPTNRLFSSKFFNGFVSCLVAPVPKTFIWMTRNKIIIIIKRKTGICFIHYTHRCPFLSYQKSSEAGLAC